MCALVTGVQTFALPILVIALARDLGVDPRPLVIAVMFAASASFATPIGYPTNTLVYAAGNYRFTDFFTAGIPLTLIVGLATCIAIALLARSEERRVGQEVASTCRSRGWPA